MTDKQKEILTTYLSNYQLDKFNGLNDRGEFVNYPKRETPEYYGIKGKIVEDGIIIRETITKVIYLDSNVPSLSTIEQVTFRNIQGFNIIVKRELSVDIDINIISLENYKALNYNKRAMDELYDDYDSFIREFKENGKTDNLKKEYYITQYTKFLKNNKS